MKALQYVTCLLSLLALPLCSVADAPKENRLQLDIAAQPIDGALHEFARQSGLQIFLPTAEGKGIKTTRLVGSFTAQEALAKLLMNTGLRFEYIDKRTIAIRAIEGGSPSAKQSSSADPEAASQIIDQSVLLLASVGAEKADEAVAGKGKGVRKTNNDVEEMVVEEGRIRPFSDANVDIPRTMNDPQPYYIFDSETIQRSAAINVEDFLKQRLTMNTVAQTTSQISGADGQPIPSQLGSTSEVNLRGLGTDKTLILINGRRMAAADLSVLSINRVQADLNSIPMAAIDRIEVLPSSASGIYGASALGGVVNVILKKSYTGGEIRTNYENVWDSDSPQRSITMNYGMGLGAKTQLMVSAAWSDAKALLLQDRRELFDKGMEKILSNLPSYIYSGTTPFLGALPNITSTAETLNGVRIPDPGVLTLRDGRSLGSRNTYIPAGTSASTAQAQLYQGLLQNAGSWNLDLPATAQNPTGLFRQIGRTPTTKSARLSLRHEFRAGLDTSLEVMHSENNSFVILPPNSTSRFIISSASPYNPFTSAVILMLPNDMVYRAYNDSTADSASLSFSALLPHDWGMQGDYSWSSTTMDSNFAFFETGTPGVAADVNAGLINPFVDVVAYPVDLRKFARPRKYDFASSMHNWALRASGPLYELPWGKSGLTMGLERRINKRPENYRETLSPLRPQDSTYNVYFARQQVTDSIYGELLVPLVKAGRFPLLDSLELQLAGRSERYVVDAGTPGVTVNFTTGVATYDSPTLSGRPYFAKDSYVANNNTIALKYQPLSQLILRVSQATAFLPPSPNQLIRNPVPNNGFTSINDPNNGNLQFQVQTISGGNPNLVPQNSNSFNAGLIWSPTWSALAGLRLNAEYYKIQQFDAIGSLDAQMLVNDEKTYPDRVVRNTNGVVTMVDTSLLNLYTNNTSGWDISADYRFKTTVGTFSIQAIESIILELSSQYSLSMPAYDSVGFPSEGGAAKYKSNLQVVWDHRNWTAGWSARYFGSYKQYGTAGGPFSILAANGGVYLTKVAAQGSDTIPSQMYHDLFVGYSFDEAVRGAAAKSGWRGGWLSGVTIQGGVKNVFDKTPPFDVHYDYYVSAYGDTRLRSYWLSARKSF